MMKIALVPENDSYRVAVLNFCVRWEEYGWNLAEGLLAGWPTTIAYTCGS